MVTRIESLEAAPLTASDQMEMAIDVLTCVEDARAPWEELAPLAPISPYQSYRFLSAWFDTIGREEQLDAFIIIARDAAGRPRALLPLSLENRGGLRFASFLGGRESNFNLGLFRAGFDIGEQELRALLTAAARRLGDPPDLIYLRNQPRRFDGVTNPLAFEDAGPSASYAYGAVLPRTVEELTARISKDTRKKLRKKEARLAEMGELAYEHRATGERAQRILSALIEQKSARFAEMGVDGVFDGTGLQDLLRRLASESGDGALELHGLSVGGRVVATYAGVTRGGRYSAMLNSFEMDEEIARSSPGDLLLHALMRDLVSRGMTHFDLGAGEARYKNAVCNETIELCDVILPVSRKGAVAAPFFSALLQAKRRVKQDQRFMRAYAAARRLLRGRR